MTPADLTWPLAFLVVAAGCGIAIVSTPRPWRWLVAFLVMAGGYLILYAQMGNFITIAGVTISAVNFGEIGTVFLLFTVAYVLRKRLGIGVFGQLDGWLWSHVYLGLLGLLFIWFHSRQRFSPQAWLPNAAMILLIFTSLSGIVGRVLYVVTPRFLQRLPDYDPPPALQRRISALEMEASSLAAFKSATFRALYEHLLHRPLDYAAASPGWPQLQQGRAALSPAEVIDFDRTAALLVQRGELLTTLGQRRRYRRLLDIWWLIHIRLTEAGAIFAALHIVDSLLIARKWK